MAEIINQRPDSIGLNQRPDPIGSHLFLICIILRLMGY